MHIAVLYSDDTISVKMTPKEFKDLLQKYIEEKDMSVSRALSKIIDDLKKMTQRA